MTNRRMWVQGWPSALSMLLFMGCSSAADSGREIPGAPPAQQNMNAIGQPGMPGQAPGAFGNAPQGTNPSVAIVTPPPRSMDPGAVPGGQAPPTMGPTPPQAVSGIEPARIDRCAGTQADVAALGAGGPVDAAMRFLYPYDGTVFPRGLEAPLLQWDAAAAGTDAALVHLSSKHFDFVGCYGSTPIGQAVIPQDAWDAAFRANEGSLDPLTIQITTIGGGVVSGPIERRVQLARATIKGSIFYNTYSSPLAASQGFLNGVVMRVSPGQSQPDVFVTAQTQDLGITCVGCHAVSADGSRMVVEEHTGVGTLYNTSLGYSLTANQSSRPPVQAQLGPAMAGFSAMYPDGSRFLTTGRPDLDFIGSSNVNGTFGIVPSTLYDANTGQEIPNTGIVPFAKMPMFNPDGTMVVFNDHDKAGVLAAMDFDPGTNTFSNWRQLASDSAHIGWPFFLPDNSGVVYATTQSLGYTSVAGKDLTGLSHNPGHLKAVHVGTKQVVPLARAMGYRDQAMTDAYVPYGARDLDVDYLPTVSPVAAGGYFWMLFTSKRNYGNERANPLLTPDGKKIWVSAISIPGAAAAGFDLAKGEDPSHPAFLLPGQELESGNIRAFAALNPCHADGDSCESGIDCCAGFCTDGVCGLPPPPPDDPPGPPRCSEIDEACTTVSDCCDADLADVRCIAGFCAFAPIE